MLYERSGLPKHESALMKTRQHHILTSLRRIASRKQASRCYYCGHHMWLKRPAAFVATERIPAQHVEFYQCTAEHLCARSEGGRDTARNIVAACRFCNAMRHRVPLPLSPNNTKSMFLHWWQRGTGMGVNNIFAIAQHGFLSCAIYHFRAKYSIPSN